VDIKWSLKIIDLEESQSKEGLKTYDADNEDCVELLGETPNEMENWWHELKRQENQGISDQTVQIELNEDKVVMNDKYEKEVVRSVGIMRKQGKVSVSIELINFEEDLYAEKRHCEFHLNQEVNSEEQIELMKGEIRMSQKDEMVLNLQYGGVELEMSSVDDSNRITIVLQVFIDEEDISDVDYYISIILKSAEMKLLEEEILQVPNQAGKILSFQEICGVTGMLRIEVRSSEVIVGDQWRRNLYISETYMENYWDRDYDVLIQ